MQITNRVRMLCESTVCVCFASPWCGPGVRLHHKGTTLHDTARRWALRGAGGSGSGGAVKYVKSKTENRKQMMQKRSRCTMHGEQNLAKLLTSEKREAGPRPRPRVALALSTEHHLPISPFPFPKYQIGVCAQGPGGRGRAGGPGPAGPQRPAASGQRAPDPGRSKRARWAASSPLRRCGASSPSCCGALKFTSG
jgi:hypothetical protein